jgi:hypothetical protein
MARRPDKSVSTGNGYDRSEIPAVAGEVRASIKA